MNARLRRAALRMSVLVALPQRLSLVALLLVLSSPAGAAPVKGEVAVSTAGGYARFVFTLSEDTDADVRLNNGILIVAFKNSGGDRGRQYPARRRGLCRRGAARSGRAGRTPRAQSQGHCQYDGGRRKAVRRSLAGRLERVAPRPAAGGGRGPRTARSRCGEERAAKTARRTAAGITASARARRSAADIRTLHLSPAGVDLGLGRSHRRSDDLQVRSPDQGRSRRRASRLAADDLRDRHTDRSRKRHGALRLYR